MKTIKANISDVDVLVQIADNISVTDTPKFDFLAAPQGIDGGSFGETIKKATGIVTDNVFESASKLIFAFAENCKKQFETYDNTPDELEIEYSLSLDLKTSLWIVTSGAESVIKVRMKWKND